MKLKREAHGFYIKPSNISAWYLVGKNMDSLNVEMNGSFEQTKDVTGEVSVSDNGYQPQISVEPYYANPEDSIYDFLKDLAMNRKSGDDASVKYLEVIVEDTSADEHDAWQENARIEIVSYGGDTSGFQIAYNVWPDGGRVKGKVTFDGKIPTFVENESTL